MNVNELSSRLERLERENRWMKRAGFAVVGVALVVALTGAATPNEIPEVIEARAFRVIDENGVIRIGISDRGIVHSDENDTLRAAMGTAGFFYADENGKARTRITRGSTVWNDENGATYFGIGDQGIFYRDGNGKMHSLGE